MAVERLGLVDTGERTLIEVDTRRVPSESARQDRAKETADLRRRGGELEHVKWARGCTGKGHVGGAVDSECVTRPNVCRIISPGNRWRSRCLATNRGEKDRCGRWSGERRQGHERACVRDESGSETCLERCSASGPVAGPVGSGTSAPPLQHPQSPQHPCSSSSSSSSSLSPAAPSSPDASSFFPPAQMYLTFLPLVLAFSDLAQQQPSLPACASSSLAPATFSFSALRHPLSPSRTAAPPVDAAPAVLARQAPLGQLQAQALPPPLSAVLS